MYGIWNNNYGNFYSSSFGVLTPFGYLSNTSRMIPNYAPVQHRQPVIISHMNKPTRELIRYERNSKKFDSEFKSVFNQLKAASSALKSFSNDSVFHPRGNGSSDSSVATVTRDTAPMINPIHLEVTQTAASTSYSSEALRSADHTLQGQHTLTITGSDGNTTSIDVEFDSTRDNKTNLNRMASALNERNLGITASVSEVDGESRLVFSSDKTGTENAFSASLTGESAMAVGIQETTQARNAKYTVNGGEELVSQSNTIELLDGSLGVTLKGVGSADIGPKTVDDAQTVDAVKKFAESYNNVLNFLNKYKGQSRSLDSMAYTYGLTRLQSGALSRIGIDVDSKGNLSVNERRLGEALRNNREDVEKLMNGAGGLATTTYGRTVSHLIMQNSKSFYPKPAPVSNSSYMYGHNRKYVNSYMNGAFFNILI